MTDRKPSLDTPRTDPRAARKARLRRASEVLGWLVILLSATILVVGWWFRVEIVAALLPGEATTKANLALALAFAGWATVTLSSGERRRLADVLGGLILLIGAITLFQHLAGSTSTGFDELLAAEFADAPSDEAPGRMSFNSAIALALIGGGILLDGRHTISSRILVVGAGLIGYLAFVGYVLAVPRLSGLMGATAMALTTAVLLMAVTVALMLLQPPELIVTEALGGDIARRFLPTALVGITLLAAALRWFLAAMLEDPLFAVQITVVVVISMTMLGTATIANRVNRISEDLHLTEVRLNAANAELSRFASVAAHDLRAPLRKAASFHERVRSSLDEGDVERALLYLERAEATTSRLYDLLEDILALGNIERSAMEVGPVDLNEVIEEVIADLEDRGSRDAVQTMGLPVIEADKAQMYLLFLNLISNALKFADPDRPVSVVVAARSVGDGYRTITVTDNGVGFDPATASTLFEPFQRGDDQRAEGSGIGLAICRRIAERHAGTIRADSAVGMGSTFTIRLPVRQ